MLQIHTLINRIFMWFYTVSVIVQLCLRSAAVVGCHGGLRCASERRQLSRLRYIPSLKINLQMLTSQTILINISDAK